MRTWTLVPAAAVGLLALAACDTLPGGDPGYDSWDTADSGWYDEPGSNGDVLLTSIDWNCSTSSGDWTYYARTDGWAGIVEIDIYETGSSVPWEEAHDLRNQAWDEQGTWDEWGANLRKVSTPSQVSPGSSTLFRCGYHGADSLTWMMTVYNEDNRRTDCAVWGHQPSYWINTRGYRECLAWN